MGRSTDDDPLAVRTIVVAGEEVAYSDPYVSDAERAAAGRETVAERTRALLAGNRQSAAERYAAGGLADGQEVLRVWCARDPAELRDRLGSGRRAIWAEGDVLHVLWRGDADQVTLGGGISAPMWPVPDADGLWEASLRVRRLDESVITLFVVALAAADLPFGRPLTERLTWRGPLAPSGDDDGYRPLAGQVEEHVLPSAALRADRTVTAYVPPAELADGPLAGCVLADGEATRSFAEALEPALKSGAVPPVLLVGVHNAVAAGTGRDRSDLRAQEYVPGDEPTRFAAHLSFVTDEVIPWAAARFPVGDGPWVAAGFSNGAAWAIGAAQRRPDVFGGVAALSAGVVPQQVAGPSQAVRHYLAAGTLEDGFRRSTRQWAERLRAAGVPYSHHEWAGGHDPFWWHRSLPDALAWLLA
jgi:enterochelin esterase-like enzyme